MSDYGASSTKRALARRTSELSGTSVPPIEIRAEPLDAELLEDLRNHLLAGETHYTTRPGVLELRQQLTQRIVIAGGPQYDAEQETIITAGEGEALFATLLGLGLSEGARASADDEGGRHSKLFAILGIQLTLQVLKVRQLFAHILGTTTKPSQPFVKLPVFPRIGMWIV